MGKKLKEKEDLSPPSHLLEDEDLSPPAHLVQEEEKAPTEELKPSRGFFNTLAEAYRSVVKSAQTESTPAEREEVKKKFPMVPEFIGNAAGRGWKSAQQAEYLNPTGIDKTKASEISQLQKEIEGLPASGAYQEFTNSQTFGDAASAFSRNPLKILTELTAESMSALGGYGATRIPIGAAMGSFVPLVGTGGGAIAGLADTSLALEFSNSILDSFREAGVDIKDPKQVEQAFGNEELMSKARAHAYKKSIPIALFDLVSGGVAGKVGRPAKSLVGKALRGATELSTQATLGMAGEASGELISGEQLQPGNILAEGLGEFGMTPVEATLNTINEAKPKAKPSLEQQADKIINDVADTGDNTVNAQIDSETINTNQDEQSKIREREPLQGSGEIRSEIRSEEPSSGGSSSGNEEIRESQNGENGASRTEEINQTENASEIRSNQEIGAEVGQVPEGSEENSGGNLQQTEEAGPSASDEKKQVATAKLEELANKLANPDLSELETLDLYRQLQEVRNDLRQIAPEQKPKKGAKLQKQIEESVGVNNHKKFVSQKETVNVAAALKDQIRIHYKGIEKGVKKGREVVNELLDKVKEVSKEHKFTASQVNALVNKVKGTNPFTIGSISRLNEFVDKVAANADYAEKVDVAQDLRDTIRKKSKSENQAFTINNLAKSFSKIDPSRLDSQALDYYRILADDLVSHYRSPGRIDYAAVNAERVKKFVDSYNNAQTAQRIKDVREQYGFGDEVSDEDIQNYINDEANVDEDPFSRNHTEANEKHIRDRILKTAQYSQLGLKHATVDPSQQAKVDAISNMDLSQLDNSQLVDFVRIVDNIIENNDFSNTDVLEARAKALEGAEKAQELIGKSNSIISEIGKLKSEIYSLPQIFKAAFKTSKTAAEIYRLSGLFDYYNSTSRAEGEVANLFERFQKKFKELKSKYKSFDDAKTQVEASVFGNLVRYPKGVDPEAALAQSKRNIEASIKKLEGSGQEGIAADAKSAYEKFANAQSIPEVFDIMKKENPAAYEIWQFWKDSFDNEINARLKKTANEFHNQNYVEEENYTPKKFIKTDNTIDASNEPEATSNSIGAKRQSNTAKAATNRLQKNQAINFNFYETMFRGYRESLYDIETAKTRQVLHEFFKLPQAAELVGGLENKNAIIENFHKDDEIARAYGKGEFSKMLQEFTDVIRTLSYTRALGGITQFPKQYFSVAVSTIGNLGSDAGLFFTRIPKGAESLYNIYTIGQRGRRMGGVSMSETIRYKIQSAYANSLLKALGKANKLSEKGSQIFMKSLTAGDVSVAQRSWIAYYLQSLKKSGVDLSTVDLTKEANLQNQEERKQAAAYAEQKVKETQLVSNPEELGKAFKTTPGAETVIKNIFVPFSSFAINTKIRMVEGINRIRLNPNDSEAYRELGAAVAEMVAFSSVKYFIIQAAINGIAKPALEGMFGLKGTKKKEKDEDDLRFKKWYSDIIKDALPTAVGTGATSATVESINWLEKLVEDPDMSYEEWKKQKKEFIYNYNKQPTDLGLYSVGLETFRNFINDAQLAYNAKQGNRLTTTTDYGESKVKLSDSQKTFVMWTALAETLALVGLMDADLYNLTQKINREQIRKGVKKAK